LSEVLDTLYFGLIAVIFHIFNPCEP